MIKTITTVCSFSRREERGQVGRLDSLDPEDSARAKKPVSKREQLELMVVSGVLG